jgi:hypothetical protein
LSCLENIETITNSNGRKIALIGLDAATREWRINIYGAQGFSTRKEARDFWHANFDPETGKYLGEPKKADRVGGRKPGSHSPSWH